MSTSQNRKPASLCERCEAVPFDDDQYDGFKRVATEGGEHLGYDGPPRQENSDGEFEFRVDFDLDDTLPHLPELTRGAESGCDFCAYLKSLLLSDEIQCRLSDIIVHQDEENLPVSVFLYYRWGPWMFFDGQGPSSLIVSLYMDEPGLQTIDNGDKIELDILLSVGSDENQSLVDDACGDWLRLPPSPQTNHMTEKKMNWMASHIRDCCEGRHSSKCSSPKAPTNDVSWLPTRLVDVTGPSIRLVYGKELMAQVTKHGQPVPRYAALSYCWGLASHAREQLKTETRSEEQMHKEIPTGSVTRAIMDAIQLAQALQIPFLWVDSLCILQDDVADWERESSQMGTIYSNALVTFCSLGSTSLTSFLQPPSPSILIPFQSRLHDAAKGAYILRYSSYTIGKANRPDSLQEMISNLPEVVYSRWFQRGWTHQEYTMSARLLFFGPHFVHFLCPSLTATEGNSEQNMEWQFLLRGASTDARALYDDWGRSIATVYSDRQFSKREDVLPAISGLASYFSNALGDEYIAGLWRKDFVRGLMWSYCAYPDCRFATIHNLLTNLRQPDGYIAPSWSWIGRRNIELDLYGYTRIFEGFETRCDIEATVDVQGQNPFGRISHSQIGVTSPTFTVSRTSTTSQKNHDQWPMDISLRDGTTVSCDLDWRGRKRLEDQFKLLVLGSVDWARTQDEDKSIAQAADEEVDSRTPNIDVFGLLLHTAPEEGKFYRVGVFYSYSRQGGGLRLLDHCETETICVV